MGPARACGQKVAANPTTSNDTGDILEPVQYVKSSNSFRIIGKVKVQLGRPSPSKILSFVSSLPLPQISETYVHQHLFKLMMMIIFPILASDLKKTFS